MKKWIVLFSLCTGPVFAQTPDPRLCAVQLNAAETDAGNVLKMVHSLGAQVDLLKADLATAQEALAKEKAKNTPPEKVKK